MLDCDETVVNVMTRVYLGGRMGGRLGAEVLSERKHAVECCISWDLEPIDPAIGEGIDPNKQVDLSMDYLTMKSFVTKDEQALRTCNVMLVLTGDTPSEGTGWEMGFAHYVLHLPIIMVAPKRVSGTLMGFSNMKADAIFSTVEEAVEFIAENFGGY